MFTKNLLTRYFLGLSILALLITACVPAVQGSSTDSVTDVVNEPPASSGNQVIDDLMAALQAADHPVSLGEKVQQEFFSVEGQKLIVNGEEVQVFVYPDEAARKSESDQISPDGSTIGTTMVTWVDQPNIWAQGSIIALYVGTDATAIELLTRVLGDPIATGEVEPLTDDMPGGLTGIESLDEIIAATLAGDRTALKSMLDFRSIPCTTADGLGGPPRCLAGEADGTLVEVLPILSSEGTFLKKSELDTWMLDVAELYAVYQVSDKAFSDENYPAGEYALVFVADQDAPTSITLQVRDDRIVRLDYGFSYPPEISPNQVESYLIEPGSAYPE